MRVKELLLTNRGQECQRLLCKQIALMRQMSAQARGVFQRYMLNEYLRTGERPTQTYKGWVAADYLGEPVSVREFVLNPYYLGKSLATAIYPRLLLDLEELFAGEYTEVVLGGGIGTGKTTFAAIVLAYDIYLVSCLRDPAAAYGMVPGTPLTFLNVSVDLTQARNVLFEGLFNLVRNSPHFLQQFPFDTKLTNEIRFRRHKHGPVIVRCRPAAATRQSQLGVAVFSGAIDEANFMARTERSKRARPGEGGIFDQAAAIYNLLSQRIWSRLNQRGKLPGHLLAMSSAQYGDDFIERKQQEARDNPLVFVRRYAPWDVKPADRFTCNPDGSLRTFRVDLGDLTRRPRVLKGNETDIDDARVMDVPVDFLPEFTRNIEDAVRNLCGRSVLAVNPFIINREAIHRIFELGEDAGLKHPFSKVDENGGPLDVTLQGAAAEVEHLVPKYLHWTSRQKSDSPWPSIFYNDAPMIAEVEHLLFPAFHYAHIDLSKNRDASGLAIGHVIGAKQVPRLGQDHKPITENLPIIRMDLVLRIVAPPGGEIDIPSIRALFYQLRDHCGMEFGLITFDSFGSQESLKNLKDNGFTCDDFSVDDDFTAYDMLKQALYDERLLCYPHPKLQEELVRLERTAKKVDHPSTPGSSKDLADCVAAVVHHCHLGWAKGTSNGLFKF
jgi:hypothetical protein